MLLTTCPNCQAQFKVTPEQLNVRSGRVMCGRCRHVFNSFESLQRIDSTLGDPPDLTTVNLPARAGSLLDDVPPVPAQTPGAPTPAVHDAHPTDHPPGDIRDLRAAVAEESDFSASRAESMLASTSTSDYAISDPPSDSHADQTDPSPSSPFDLNAPEAARASTPVMGPSAPYRNAPLLPRETASGPSIGWTLLAFLSVLALAGQAAYAWRSEIVSQYPVLRPGFDKACETLGCTLPWGRDASLIKVESSDLIEELGTKGRFLLTATFTNRSSAMQDFPHLELSLTDTNNQTLTRRVLAPEAYLGRKPARGEGLAPGAVAPVNVRIESQLPGAAGYHLEPIFP